MVPSTFLLFTHFLTSFENTIFKIIPYNRRINSNQFLNTFLKSFFHVVLFSFQTLLLTICSLFTTFFKFLLSISVTTSQCCNSQRITFTSFIYFVDFANRYKINLSFISTLTICCFFFALSFQIMRLLPIPFHRKTRSIFFPKHFFRHLHTHHGYQ